MSQQQFSLTPRQRDALTFIAATIGNTGAAPSVEEIGTALGLRSKGAVAQLLQRLESRGAIRRLGRLPRSIVIVEQHGEPLALPRHVHARLARYCADHDEELLAVLADAVALHLDRMEAIHAAEKKVPGGGER